MGLLDCGQILIRCGGKQTIADATFTTIEHSFRRACMPSFQRG